jgi:CHAT domain-containing protein
MKLFQLSIKITLVLTWLLIATNVRSQTGNMSDITMPNPGEVTPDDTTTGENPDAPTDDTTTGENPDAPTDDTTTGENPDAPTDDTTTGENPDAPTDDTTTGENPDAPTDDTTTGENPDAPTDDTTTGENPDAPTDDTTTGGNPDAPTDDTTTGGNPDAPTDDTTTGGNPDAPTDDTTTGGNPDAPTDDTTTGGNPDAPTDDTTTGGNPDAPTENTTANDNNADENVMDAIADDTPEQEVITNEDDLGTTVGEGISGNSNSDITSEPAEPTINDSTETTETVDPQPTTTSSGNRDNSSETETTTKDEVAEEVDDVTATERTEEKAKVTEELEEDTETTAETEEEETAAQEDESSQNLGQEVDRIAYEVQVQESTTDVAIQMHEEYQSTQLMDASGLQVYGQVPSVKEISNRLAELGQQTGKNAAFINISVQSDQLEAFVVLPNQTKSASREGSLVASTNLDKIDSSTLPSALTLRETVKNTSREELIATATEFREEVSNSSKLSQTSYMKSAQELYKVLIEPIEAELAANNIDILVFSMDSGLRLLPLAALHDGKQFLIEKYAVATVPSFGLTDTRYVSLGESPILAMGASKFTEQAALPTMELELDTIVSQPRRGEVFINEQFTIENFKAQNRRETPFPIVHLGTHAEFKAGSLNDSYIQFYDSKLKIPQLQDLSNELGWNSDAAPIELLVLSACETALGDEEAELGFAGLAVQAGVKSALASLWYVSDVGTLALMGEFYDQLDGTLIKAEALRQTQLKMLKGQVKVDQKQVKLSSGQNLNLPSEFPEGTLSLNHPYFWSSFTLIGSWN